MFRPNLYWTENKRHSSGTPLRLCAPRSPNLSPEPARDLRRPAPAGQPSDYGFVGEMSVLMSAYPLIGPALAQLFLQVMFAPGALARPEREMVAAMAAAAQDCHY